MRLHGFELGEVSAGPNLPFLPLPQDIGRWAVYTPLSVKVFVTLSTQ
jgi:hypothetical protein